jgi:type IV secretion system protein VirB4
MLRAIGSSRFAVYHHILRRRVQPGLAGEFADDFSRRLDGADRASRCAKLYANDLFLTIIRRPLQGRGGVADRITRLIGRAAGEEEARAAGELRALEAASEQVVASLSAYGARVLGVYDTPQGPCSEVLEFLSALYNGELGPVRLPHGDAGEHLPWRRVSFGADTVEMGRAAGWIALSAIVSIKDLSGADAAGAG